MALNLWKLAGKPTSYNPLPIGWHDVSIPYGDFIILVTAKSQSNAVLYICDTFGNQLAWRATLSSEYTTYQIKFNNRENGQALYIKDDTNKGDIIIQDIQLVEKPLQKPTVNGIDGFLSGNWNLHDNARVIDDETLELDATGIGNNSSIDLPVLPNQIVTLSINELNANHVVYVQAITLAKGLISNLSALESGSGKNIKTYVVPSNCYFLRVHLGNLTSTGTFTFKRPMLNLGTIPAPYEPKRGEKMVMPVPKKNLFDGVLENGYILTGTGMVQLGLNDVHAKNKIPVQGGKTYTFKMEDNNSFAFRRIAGYDLNKNFISILYSQVGLTDGKLTLAIPQNVSYIDFSIADGDLTKRYQLEEGTVATAYEPYAVQINPKPKVIKPKKNLISDFESNWEQGTIANTSDILVAENTRLRTKQLTNITTGKVYSVSCANGFEIAANKGAIGNTTFANTATFTAEGNNTRIVVRKTDLSPISPSEIILAKPQLEEGSSSTTYEPYTLVAPRAKTGLSFDGVSQYLQLPSMTMDSIEIECLIDSVQPNATNLLFDARQGTNAYVWNGTFAGISSMQVDGVTKTQWADIPKNQRTRVRINTASAFTDNVNVFSIHSESGLTSRTKGTLYKVTCYLAGAIVAQYDFENPNNIVGNKVIPNAKNLIPSFEDSRWNLHANAKVLGKDVLKLDATAIYQSSRIDIPIKENVSYLASYAGNMWFKNAVGSVINGVAVNKGGSIVTCPLNTVRIQIEITNISIGTVEFIRPQLFELTGKEAAMVGSPQKIDKDTKRQLYTKR